MVMDEKIFRNAMHLIKEIMTNLKKEFASDTEMQDCITVMQSNSNEMNKIFASKYRKCSS